MMEPMEVCESAVVEVTKYSQHTYGVEAARVEVWTVALEKNMSQLRSSLQVLQCLVFLDLGFSRCYAAIGLANLGAPQLEQ